MKRILVIFTILFLCGCNATYKLEIKDKVFKENVSINAGSLKYFKDNKFYAIMDGASNFVEYDKKIKNNNVNFLHIYSFNDYSKATVLKTCFDAYNIIEEDDYYLLSTSKGVKCAVEEDRVLLDDLKIIIKTNHVVKDSNANSKSNNKYEYVWKFNKDNYEDASISMKIYKDKYVFNYNNEFVIKVAITIGIVLTILVIVFIIRRKVKKANKI